MSPQNEGWRGLLTQQTALGNAVVEYKPLNRSCTSACCKISVMYTVNVYVPEIGLINLTKQNHFFIVFSRDVYFLSFLERNKYKYKIDIFDEYLKLLSIYIIFHSKNFHKNV